MKLYKQIIFILIVFFKTETILSENNLFNVNNINIEKKDKETNKAIADQAIKNGFSQLITKILLKEDADKLKDLNFSSIKQLVTHYQISNSLDDKKNSESINFSITFDKDKIHNLFFKRGISYSEILDKELYVLPILIENNEIFIFTENFLYENWNKVHETELIEFILISENIEIIQSINNNKNNLININIDNLFKEYQNKNLALIFIENTNSKIEKGYIRSRIQGKNLSKSLNFKRQELETENFYETIIMDIKKEIINSIKSVNLIDIRTPSFLNVKLNLDKKNNLVELKKRLKKIDSIENIFVQDFNKDIMNIKIKYFGKLEKSINQLKKENINLKLINSQWIIRIL